MKERGKWKRFKAAYDVYARASDLWVTNDMNRARKAVDEARHVLNQRCSNRRSGAHSITSPLMHSRSKVRRSTAATSTSRTPA